jgi:heme/copper-type cytochrome/quinol oxidase subunit 2
MLRDSIDWCTFVITYLVYHVKYGSVYPDQRLTLPRSDSPENFQLNFQDPATGYMEGVFLLNESFLVLIFVIVAIVGWLMSITVVLHQEDHLRKALVFFHASAYESGWTVVPLVLLMLLLKPSMALLYSLQGEPTTDVSVKIVGHQWYWHYEVTENLLCLPEQITYFYAYHLADEFMCLDKSGIKRNLEADRRLILPLGVQVKMSVSGADVLHSWTIPSFGIKIDACPGRSNIVYVVVKRIGLFFGQCSEICGVNHGFMPIVAVTCPAETFRVILNTRLNNLTHMF